MNYGFFHLSIKKHSIELRYRHTYYTVIILVASFLNARRNRLFAKPLLDAIKDSRIQMGFRRLLLCK